MSKLNMLSGPTVALESTVIAHGLPYPQNLQLAQEMEAVIRAGGAEPRTVAILGGELLAGLTPEQLHHLATAQNVRKVSRRDLPIVVARREDGATTVATTMWVAQRFGIEVFATGGIGGVHRGDATDVSADLQELAQTPVIVVCAGAKAILDLPATLEYLETHGVTVIGYGRMNCRPSTAAAAACASTCAATARQRWRRSGAPSSSWECPAGCWSPSRFLLPTRFLPRRSSRISSRPWLKLLHAGCAPRR